MQELGTVTDSKQAAEKITKMVNDFLNTKQLVYKKQSGVKIPHSKRNLALY